MAWIGISFNLFGVTIGFLLSGKFYQNYQELGGKIVIRLYCDS